MQLFGGLFSLSVNMIVTVLRLVVIGLGSWLIIHGHLTTGGLVAFMSLMGEVLSPVTTLTALGQQIQSATRALVRINEVLGAEPEIVDARTRPRSRRSSTRSASTTSASPTRPSAGRSMTSRS